MMGSGYTPVHTTFVPPLAVLGRKGGREQENINPNLNVQQAAPRRMPSPPISEPSMFVQAPTTPPIANNLNMHSGNLGAFDAFADMNPFTLKTLDAYRMQLWGKMAAQGHLYQQQQQISQQPQQLSQHQMLQQQLLAQQQQQSQPQVSGLAQALRPAFFKDAGLAGMLAGKSATSSSSPSPSAAYPSPPSTPKLSAAGARTERENMQRDAMYATLASQTLLSKLGGAFWDAFSGSSSSSTPSTSSPKQWDAEKVRKVLEGKAVVRVVDVDSPLPPAPVAKMDVKAVVPTSTSSSSSLSARPECSLTSLLEESMRGLTLAGKSNK